MHLNDEFSYPIVTNDGTTYTLEGKLCAHHKAPSAFIEPPECFNPELKPFRFKKGDRVLVRDYNNEEWKRRYFSHEKNTGDDRRFAAFSEGRDEWSSKGEVYYWKYCKSWKEDEE